jgi:hypothetical protein
MHQYRITVDGTTRQHDAYPGEAWARAADAAEERGFSATLYRRLVTDANILDFFGGALPQGWMCIGGKVATDWEVFAQVRG